MKICLSLAVVTALVGLHPGVLYGAGTEQDGVALAIVYDTSGSMKDVVRDAKGGSSPKYIIANRALSAVAKQIQAFAGSETGQSQRVVQAALFIFRGEQVRQELPLAPFKARTYEDWAARFNSPAGNTPLGNALTAAGRCVLASPLTRKHVLVITDGINTAGPTPSATLPKIKQEAAAKGTSLGVHFVAFDIDAKLFDPLKKQGVTVVGAADEKQLTGQLEFILAKKILLEDEEPAPSPSPGGDRREGKPGTNNQTQ